MPHARLPGFWVEADLAARALWGAHPQESHGDSKMAKHENGKKKGGSAQKPKKPPESSSSGKRPKKAKDLDIKDYYPIKGQLFPIPMS